MKSQTISRRNFITQLLYSCLGVLFKISFPIKQEKFECDIETLVAIIKNHNSKIKDILTNPDTSHRKTQIRIQSLYALQTIYNEFSYILRENQKTGRLLADVTSILKIVSQKTGILIHPLIEKETQTLYFLHGKIEKMYSTKQIPDIVNVLTSVNQEMQILFMKNKLSSSPTILLVSQLCPILSNIGAITLDPRNPLTLIIINQDLIDKYPEKDRKNIFLCLLYNEIGNIIASHIYHNTLPESKKNCKEWEELISDVVMVLTSLKHLEQTQNPSLLNTSLHLIIMEFWKHASSKIPTPFKYKSILTEEINRLLEVVEMNPNTPYSYNNAIQLINKMKKLNITPEEIRQIYIKILESSLYLLHKQKQTP